MGWGSYFVDKTKQIAIYIHKSNIDDVIYYYNSFKNILTLLEAYDNLENSLLSEHSGDLLVVYTNIVTGALANNIVSDMIVLFGETFNYSVFMVVMYMLANDIKLTDLGNSYLIVSEEEFEEKYSDFVLLN